MEVRTRLSGGEVAGLLSAILEYNGFRPLRVELFFVGSESHTGVMQPDEFACEVVCEHPGLKVRVEPEEQQDRLLQQMAAVVAMTPNALPKARA